MEALITERDGFYYVFIEDGEGNTVDIYEVEDLKFLSLDVIVKCIWQFEYGDKEKFLSFLGKYFKKIAQRFGEDSDMSSVMSELFGLAFLILCFGKFFVNDPEAEIKRAIEMVKEGGSE